MENRHAFRASWHDYNIGTYFVTICADNRKQLFGYINNDVMCLSAIGHIVDDCISHMSDHNTDVQIFDYVVMPNHVHIILNICDMPDHESSLKNGCLNVPGHGKVECNDYHYNARLAVVIRTFKAACSKLAQSGIWQRGFYERILRNKIEYELAANYIEMNVINWAKDRNHPNA